MGADTATIEMRTPEEHRERLHDLVKATRKVMVLSSALGSNAGVGGINGAPMAVVRTDDDTTMYVATVLDAAQCEALARNREVTVVVPCDDCALFVAEVTVSRDRELIELLWSESWRLWCRGRTDPAIAVVVLSPIEGWYWERMERHAYQYKLRAPREPAREYVSDGIPVEILSIAMGTPG
jgi:general stress protein 26